MKYSTIGDLSSALESVAPSLYAESYDNVGLLVGRSEWKCEKVLVALDITEAVVQEAIEKGVQAIVAHHPVIFGGIQRLTGEDTAQRAIELAIKHSIALLACHTNLDAIEGGVSYRMAQAISLVNVRTLQPRSGLLWNLIVYVPAESAETLLEALWEAGAGKMGAYDECAFRSHGLGSFRPKEGAHPHNGVIGERAFADEIRLELLVPEGARKKVHQCMMEHHPYEEIAHSWLKHDGVHHSVGFGAIGQWDACDWPEAVRRIKTAFGVASFRHTMPIASDYRTVAVCGGAGADLLAQAKSQQAELFITSDITYHRYFGADDRLVFIDIGHWESEQHAMELLIDIVREKFPNFAVLKSETNTNPMHLA